jgi:hypothetical protein
MSPSPVNSQVAQPLISPIYFHPSVCKISLDCFLFACDSGTIREVGIHVPTIAQRHDKTAIFLKLFSTDWASKKSSMRD